MDELKEKLESQAFALLLDVRGPEEFAQGHVPGARNSPLPDLTNETVLQSDLKDYKDKPVAVICGIGKRSAQATVRMSKVSVLEFALDEDLELRSWDFRM